MRKHMLIAALAAGLATPALAQEAVPPAPQEAAQAAEPAPIQWMSVAEIARDLEDEGYTVLEIERERGAYEVNAIDAQGMRVEALLDSETGEVLRGGEARRGEHEGRREEHRRGEARERGHDRDDD